MPKYLFCGGFNAWVTNTFGALSKTFVWKMISSFPIMHCYPRTYLHISDAHNTTSWIDHFISSFSVHQAMYNM